MFEDKCVASENIKTTFAFCCMYNRKLLQIAIAHLVEQRKCINMEDRQRNLLYLVTSHPSNQFTY